MFGYEKLKNTIEVELIYQKYNSKLANKIHITEIVLKLQIEDLIIKSEKNLMNKQFKII